MFKIASFLLAFVALLLCAGPINLLRQSSIAAQSELPAPNLFAEGIINTPADEYGPTFTPDGQTVYFVRRVSRSGPEHIMVSRFAQGRWSEPRVAEFSGQYFDKEPFVAPDGKRLFFASQRPVSGTEPKKGRDFDLWYVEKVASGWSMAKHLGPTVNTPGYENYPAVTADGTLYFASVREGGKGQNDLYRSRLVNGQYTQPENLTEINTPQTDADPYVAPDGSFMIFSSDRPGSYGEGDLYLSYNRNGKWTEPRNLGPVVNTKEYEYTPLVSPDKKHLFFSRGWGEIYQIEMSALNLAALAAFDVKAWSAYAGRYELTPELTITITNEAGRLMNEARGRKVALTPVTNDRFIVAGEPVIVTFVKNEWGQVTHLLLVDHGQEGRAKKIR